MEQAVYYRELYFLLPEGYADFESFKAAVAAGPKPFAVRAVVLREDHKIPNRGVEKGVCMAPYFLTGYHDGQSLLSIADAEELCPAQAELLSQEEYNARLRELVTGFCPGCTRYKPLTDRVQSLNGHFEEIALDGFCAFRVESKPAPRELRQKLFSFGWFWKEFKFGEKDAEGLGKKLKEMLYLGLEQPTLRWENGEKRWSGRAKDAFDAQIGELVSAYVEEVLDPSYRIEVGCKAPGKGGFPESTGSESFRKACRKYGVSLLTLRYPPEGEEKLGRSLEELIERWYLFPLVREEGCRRFLALDTAEVLKALHYRLPLLRTLHLEAELAGQYGEKRYAFGETMRELI